MCTKHSSMEIEKASSLKYSTERKIKFFKVLAFSIRILRNLKSFCKLLAFPLYILKKKKKSLHPNEKASALKFSTEKNQKFQIATVLNLSFEKIKKLFF